MSVLPDFGRHAAYVWPAYAVAFGGLGLLAILSLLRMRMLEKQARTARERRGDPV